MLTDEATSAFLYRYSTTTFVWVDCSRFKLYESEVVWLWRQGFAQAAGRLCYSTYLPYLAGEGANVRGGLGEGTDVTTGWQELLRSFPLAEAPAHRSVTGGAPRAACTSIVEDTELRLTEVVSKFSKLLCLHIRFFPRLQHNLKRQQDHNSHARCTPGSGQPQEGYPSAIPRCSTSWPVGLEPIPPCKRPCRWLVAEPPASSTFLHPPGGRPLFP